MKKNCGIYIIKNKINNMVYIGQSVNIMARWYAHKQAAKQPRDQSYNTDIHKAMRALGVENFHYEILENCSFKELSEKEIFWIAKFDSYNNGYNMTPGGESLKGEFNGRAKLTQSMVEDIRLAYNAHIPFREVYEKYKETISKRGLQKVWQFETWRHIMPEVYTEENRLWHKTQAKQHINGNKEFGYNNKQRACTEEEIQKMRKLRNSGLSYKRIAQQVGRSEGVVRKYCLFQECKNKNKVSNSIKIKNIETGLIFDSYTEGAKWAKCDRHTISNYINMEKTAGRVPTTNKPAHWISL